MKHSAIQKLYYSITEVSRMIGEEQHVLRYWEREFSQLRPQKNRAGNRVYTQRDMAVLRIVKRLLRQERYTVAGAKEYLKQHDFFDEVERETQRMEGGEVAVAEAPQTEDTNPRRTYDPEGVQAVIQELRDIASTLRRKAM
ncbi:MAG: MerR family transcriptional regulator [Bacteroidetes bacterium]|nr:MerR family transcriptional regulator [Bacteroidota bacterium]